MFIKNTITGEQHEAVITPVDSIDFKAIKKNKEQFNKFDWEEYQDKEIYKLTQKNDKRILGLMCLVDHEDKSINAVEIVLLEVGEENIGAKKKFERIGGCLFAFACRESFKRGHEGVVFLTPKTRLVDHYVSKYGFLNFPFGTTTRPEGILVLNFNESMQLIKEYI